MTARQMHILSLIAQTSKALTARRSRRVRAKPGADAAAGLIAALAAARCPVAAGPSVTAAEVIGQDAAHYDHAPALEVQGVALAAGRRGPRGSFRAGKTRVFVESRAAKRHLLAGTRWTAREVARVLLAVPGAERRQRCVGGRRRWGVDVPLAAWGRLAQGTARDLSSPSHTPAT